MYDYVNIYSIANLQPQNKLLYWSTRQLVDLENVQQT